VNRVVDQRLLLGLLLHLGLLSQAQCFSGEQVDLLVLVLCVRSVGRLEGSVGLLEALQYSSSWAVMAIHSGLGNLGRHEEGDRLSAAEHALVDKSFFAEVV
jgi:hypothetical protein